MTTSRLRCKEGVAARHIALAALLTLTSCSSTPTRVYTLSAVPPLARSAYHGVPVRVDAVHFPPALDRIELMQRVGPGEYAIDDSSHWAAPLDQSARDALSMDLLERLPASMLIFPRLPKPMNGLGIVVDVLRFDLVSGRASLEASWTISSTSPSLKSAAHRMTREWTIDAKGDGSAGTAQALSLLLGRMADDIAVDLETSNQD